MPKYSDEDRPISTGTYPFRISLARRIDLMSSNDHSNDAWKMSFLENHAHWCTCHCGSIELFPKWDYGATVLRKMGSICYIHAFSQTHVGARVCAYDFEIKKLNEKKGACGSKLFDLIGWMKRITWVFQNLVLDA